MKQDSIITQALLLGVESVIAYRDYEKKQTIFNQYLRRHKLK